LLRDRKATTGDGHPPFVAEVTESFRLMPSLSPLDSAIPDAVPGNWVTRYAPPAVVPYLQLARFDRPVGAWLLLFPCWWSLALAELWRVRPYPNLWYLVLFFIGAFVMRGAGCAYNDIIDRDLDAQVERTRSRPIPSGRVSVRNALIFAVFLSLIGLLVLIQFNRFTILLGIASLGLVALYPFAKRFTNWPQLVLGLTFKWGALVGWASIHNGIDPPAIALYAGCVLWTIGYDTIYAHQDSKDDGVAGIRSTARRFGAGTHNWVGGLYGGAVCLWALAGWLATAHLMFFASLALVSLQLAWQVTTLDTKDPANCLRRFKSNRDVGFAIFLGLIADMALSTLAGRA
jgi:4-hydroxybenzoate polyprenyltransferase